ncbi:MAG: methyltransferase domain-containing protein [Candidatus Bathyarchaeota archaeon]|nr:methyltransferase domain-containing protein [Candidatus Bathyarchaeota archaeon]
MLKKLLSSFFSYVSYPFSYNYELKRAIGSEIKTLLDIGCGSNSPVKIFSGKIHMVGIDDYIPSIAKSKQLGIHNEYYIMPFSDLKNFKNSSFDCVVALDVIEHLKKEEGLTLLDDIERIAKKRMILSTPNGFLPQAMYDNNPLQIHKSGWTPKELRKRGYNIIGYNGLKNLRGEKATIKFKPKLLWLCLSVLSQVFVRNHPDMAFQILCFKLKN